MTISNVFTNGIGCLVRNLFRKYVSQKKMLVSSRIKRIVKQRKYEEALVLVPNKSFIAPVANLNFISYYLWTIILNNISTDTRLNNFTDDSNVIIDNEKIYGIFKKYHGDCKRMEIMPLMCNDLLDAYNEAKQL